MIITDSFRFSRVGTWRPLAGCGIEVQPLEKPLLNSGWLLGWLVDWLLAGLAGASDFIDFMGSKNFLRFHGFQGSDVWQPVAPCGIVVLSLEKPLLKSV